MTPERQRWWNSLPKEERLVRLAIKKEKQYLSLYKSEAASTINIWDFIKYQKLLIKAMRKQIAMNVLVKKVGNKKSYVCPNCHAEAGGYCWYCGQKLRWN